MRTRSLGVIIRVCANQTFGLFRIEQVAINAGAGEPIVGS